MMEYFGYFCAGVIALNIGRVIFNVLYPFIIAKLIGKSIKDLKKFSGGSWAVVTGATDGIGKAYALFLADKGFNIVLVSRNEEKLEQVKQEIVDKYASLEVKTVQFDFGESDVTKYERVFTEIARLPVGILVNNVGISYKYPEQLHKIAGGNTTIKDIILINCLSVSLMSSVFLSEMNNRKKGVIINVSSASGDFPTPYLGVYSAAKKYVQFFTRTCIEEYKGRGIIFQGAFVSLLPPNLVIRQINHMMKTLRDKAIKRQNRNN